MKSRFSELCALLEGRDDEAVFGWLVRRVIEVYREDPRFERLMLYAALEGHEIAVMHLNMVSPFVDALRKYVLRRQQEGGLMNGDPMTLITAVVGVAKQYALNKYLFCHLKGEDSDERAAEILTGFAMDGLAVRSRKRKK